MFTATFYHYIHLAYSKNAGLASKFAAFADKIGHRITLSPNKQSKSSFVGLGNTNRDSVCWSRVRKYLGGFGFFFTSGERVQAGSAAQIFIPESIFYLLAKS